MSNADAQLAQLTAEQKRARLAALLRDKARAQVADVPLSYGQRALWFLYRLAPQSPAYNLIYTATLPGDLPLETLQQALSTLVARHPALRTTYTTVDGQPVQRVHPTFEGTLEHIDATALSPRQFHDRLAEEADRPFDLERGPVLRAKLWKRPGNGQFLSLTAHHIALDIWSFDVVLTELRALCAAEQSGAAAELTPVRTTYADYVRWQNAMLASPEGKRLEAFWLDRLASAPTTLDLPCDHVRPPVQTYRGTTHQFDLGERLTARLKNVANTHRATLFMTLLAAFKVLLYRYTGQEDLVVGSPALGRTKAEFEPIVGYFVNPIALRSNMAGSPTFAELLAQVRQTVFDGLAHQDYPFALLVEKLQPPRDPTRSPLFQVAFDWYATNRDDAEGSPIQRADTQQRGNEQAADQPVFSSGQRGAPFDLMLMMVTVDRSLTASFQYNTDLFEPATIARMCEHFRTLLEAIAENPNRPIDALPLLGSAERRCLLGTWNETQADYARDACIHDLVAAQAERTPEAVAVAFGEVKLTYTELDRRANQLARHLQELGVGPGRRVGICVERSLEMLVAALGVLKSGGAYVPLDPTYPRERLALMVEDSRPTVLLVQEALAERVPHGDTSVGPIETMRIDTEWPRIAEQDDTPLPSTATADDAAYVIYTSGSTGRPKGVEVLHRGVVNFLQSMAREPGIAADDRLLGVTTLSFDISVLELFLPLVVGARLVLLSRAEASDGVRLRAAVEQSGITFLQATPATWRLLIEAGWPGSSRMTALCGGEALPRDLAEALLPRVGSLWNVYGPTETTIWSTIHRVASGPGPVSIGRPIANTRLYLLDRQRQPVPIGVPGELFIGGDGVARGYWARPELTAERFVPDPFRDDSGARLYRTGDLARYTPEGNLEFLGRLDHQVKISGHRIELGEIETILGRHPAVRQCVVVARGAARLGEQRLAAYYVVEGSAAPNVSRLRDFLKQHLPDYMVPAVFIALEALPLTPNGKVDRRALPEPDTSRPELEQAYVAPRTETQRRLAELCATVLEIDKVGIHDNFFDLGGASIQALEVATRAEQTGIRLTPEMLFKHQTVAELAAAADAEVANDKVKTGRDGETHREGEAPAEPWVAASGSPSQVGPRKQSEALPVADKLIPGNTVIESLGVYLPERVVSTDEIVQGCKVDLQFPLERMTGIRSRRAVGDGEFAIDLARKAVAECLKRSHYAADEVDLLICCNISRLDRPHGFSFEPATAVRLRGEFGLDGALAFDISNACVGMFTAIGIVDAMLRLGAIRCGMVVSGEYISHLAEVAQKEIEGFMDPRLACLTVGDAGVAMTLDAGPDDRAGFHELEMYTLGRYATLCVAEATDKPHGGAIMHSDPIRQTAVALKQSVAHAAHVIRRSRWSPEDFHHLIMHQTSETALKDAMREINAEFGKTVCHEQNTIFNLAERGNTATTSHAVALWDHIHNGRIRSGDRVLFGISGSGQTTGTALYTFDDLPDRLRAFSDNGTGQRERLREGEPPGAPPSGNSARREPRPPNGRPKRPRLRRVRIASVGLVPPDRAVKLETLPLARAAAEDCLKRSAHAREDIDLLIFAGVYRTRFLSEPAVASLLAGELGINDVITSQNDRKTFVFDILNGEAGMLSACHTAAQMLRAGKHRTALVVASEVENNADLMPERLRGIAATGSAMLLELADDGPAGFGPVVFRYATEHRDALVASTDFADGKTLLAFQEDVRLNDYYLDLVPGAVEELVAEEGLDRSAIKVVLPPQISSQFNARLAERLGMDADRFVDVLGGRLPLFSSSLPCALRAVEEQGLVGPGDVGLILSVGSGVQVGCAAYRF